MKASSFIYFLICASLVSANLTSGQPITKQWDRTFRTDLGDGVHAMLATPDGGFLLAATSRSGVGRDKTEGNRGGADYWLIKLDSNGVKKWDRTYGGSKDDELACIVASPDGGYLLGGTSNSDPSGEKSQKSVGGRDFWIVKVDGNGNKQWDSTFGGSEDDDLAALVSTNSFGYLLGGTSGYGNYWILEINSNGKKQWDKDYSISNDKLSSILKTPDGGYILGGSSSGFIHPGWNYWIVKIDRFGTEMWEKTYGGNDHDKLTTVVNAIDGGYLLAGTSASDSSGDKTEAHHGREERWREDYWIIKVDDKGNKEWDKTFGGTESDLLSAVVTTPDHGYLLAGTSTSILSSSANFSTDKLEDGRGFEDFWLIKIDKSGNKQWDKTFGGAYSDTLYALVSTAHGDIVLGGASTSVRSGDKFEDTPTSTEADCWIVKCGAPIVSKCGAEGCIDSPPILLNPATGNMRMSTTDLVLWRGLGQEPLVWKRYANSQNTDYNGSYGTGHSWTHSFQYDMKEFRTEKPIEALVTVHCPEGKQINFVKNGGSWKPLFAGAVEQLFQNNNEYILQRANGFRYRFLKLIKSKGAGDSIYFQLKDFTDSYQNRYDFQYYSNGRLSRVVEPGGRYFEVIYTSLTFNGPADVILSVRRNDGASVNYAYLSASALRNSGDLTDVKYADGTEATYTYQKGNHLLTNAVDAHLDGAATNITFTYANTFDGFTKAVKNGVTGDTLALLDASPENKTITYGNRRKQTYEMPTEQQGLVKSYTDGIGSKLSYSYKENGLGYLEKVSDALGREITFNSRTIYGNPLKITYPDATTEEWTRDSLDLVLTFQNQLGYVTTYQRDNKHRIERINYYDGSFELFNNYNDYGLPQSHKKRNGGIEYFEYDNQGLLIRFTNSENNTTTFSYDNTGQLKTRKDRPRDSTRYQYKEGLLMTVVYGDSSGRRYLYDEFGNTKAMFNELGSRWRTEFDEFRRPRILTDPLGRSTEFSYNQNTDILDYIRGPIHPTRIKLPSGKIIEFAYDAEENIVRQTEAWGTVDEASTFYQYNIVGEPIATIDPLGRMWQTNLDPVVRTITKTDPMGNKTTVWFDKIGRTETAMRPDNGVIKYLYDDKNHITTIQDPKKQETKQQYFVDENKLKFTDVRGNDYIYEYDKLDRVTKLIYPDQKFEQYNYDEVDNLKMFKNRAGNTQTSYYDSRNRHISSIWDDNLTPPITKAYDKAGRLITLSNSTSKSSYGYNEANELKSDTQTISGLAAKIINYTYSKDGLLQTLKYPNGKEFSYEYTGRNQTSAVKENGETVVQYKYDLNGNRKQKDLGKNITLYEYDRSGKMLSLDNRWECGSLFRFDYTYDKLGRIKSVQRNDDRGDVYVYNAVDRLTDIKYDAFNPDGAPSSAGRTVHYDLDAAGNRTLEVDNGTATVYSPNLLNQYTAVGGLPLEYTTNGNLKTRDGWTLSYDAQDRLIQIEKGSGVATGGLTQSANADTLIKIAYDALGRMVKTVVNGLESYSIFSGSEKIEERSAGDQPTKVVTFSQEELVAAQLWPSAQKRYYHQDAEGKIAAVTDETGDVMEYYKSDAFDGNTLIRDKNGNVLPFREISPFTPLGDIRMEKLVSDMRISPKTGAVYDTRTGIWGNDPRTPQLEISPFGGRKRTFKPAAPSEETWFYGALDVAGEYNTGVNETYYGMYDGANRFVASTLSVPWLLFTDPTDVIQTVGNAIFEPKKTGAAIKQATLQTFDQLANGSLYEQGEAFIGIELAGASIAAPFAEAGALANVGKLGAVAEAVESAAGVTEMAGSISAGSSPGKFLVASWYKGTFENRLQSILYHLGKHGKGRTGFEYTKDAMNFFNKNKSAGIQVILKDGTQGIKIQTKVIINGKTYKIGGYWTSDGRLVTFWD